MENLETRHSFDDLLIETLYRKDPLPFYFLERALDLLKIESRSQTVSSDLDYRHYYLLERLKGRRSYKRLLETAESNGQLSKKNFLSLNILTSDQVFVAKTLTGPYDPRTFRLIALWPWKRKSITRAIENMKITAPEVLKYELNPDIVGWWQGLKEKADHWAHIKHLVNRGLKISILYLLSICFLASIVYKAVELSGRTSPIVLTAIAALMPIGLTIGLVWKLFIQEAAVGRLVQKFADRIGRIPFQLIVFTLLVGIILVSVQSEFRGFAIALVITIGIIPKIIKNKYRRRK